MADMFGHDERFAFMLDAEQAEFYRTLLMEYNGDRERQGLRVDVGVRDDLLFIEHEMELRGWLSDG